LKRALITGVTGQDGAHLARFLLQKDYKVFGGCRQLARSDLWRLEALGILAHPNLTLLNYDGTDPASAIRIVTMASPDEVYNLAAQTHVGRSFEMPHATAMITGLGVLNILDAVRERRPEAKFLQASSSELFGNTTIAPQNENTPFKPRSPYGAAKLFGYSLLSRYCREKAFSGRSSIDARRPLESGFRSERPRPDQENRLFARARSAIPANSSWPPELAWEPRPSINLKKIVAGRAAQHLKWFSRVSSLLRKMEEEPAFVGRKANPRVTA
jgi:hypothetical protein